MTEGERMLQRGQLEIMLRDFSKEQRKEIEKDIAEFKITLNSESISLETIALLIFLYKKSNESKSN